MNKAAKIKSISPQYALPGGEVIIECEGFEVGYDKSYGCFFDGQRAKLVAASSERVIAIVPETFDTFEVEIYLESGAGRSESARITVAKKIAGDLHIVANPAVDPKDNSIILTRSGSRGQSLPVTLFRLEADDYLQEIPADVLNPTGIAFDKAGQFFVSNRADGEIFRINNDEDAIPFAANLGIPTGIAFNKNGVMYVGDRRGTIFRLNGFGIPEVFARIEPSVSAYHLAFDNKGDLFVCAPGLSSFDGVYRINELGEVTTYYRGLGRPQGLAFDTSDNLYLAACSAGRRGIVKISTAKTAEIFVSGMNVIGICFNKNGEMIIATNDSVYRLPVNIFGNLV
jgi:sugar lactone lactonase YvrE